MNTATRKQKGSGFFSSKPAPKYVEVDYSSRALTTEDLGELLVSEYPSQREMDNIFTLNVRDNNLVEMPAVPIQNLNSLECSFNQLTVISSAGEIPQLRSLSDLYPYLQSLYCDNNQLTSLPRLHSNLDTLVCDENLLTALPQLPEGLKTLTCSNNKLRALPVLPESLEEIVCDGNPFAAPFNKFVDEYIKTNDISVLINKVNSHLAKKKLKGGSRKTKSKKSARKTRSAKH